MEKLRPRDAELLPVLRLRLEGERAQNVKRFRALEELRTERPMGKKQALSHFQISSLLSPVLLPSCRPLYLQPVSTAAASVEEEEEEEEEEEL
ncbi:hypothetical protein NC652_027278 [Populus alba x Populus x berolinensis]|nr:hypothetical protein NC652_027278 [Populus alba x Populus x berolinensis]